MSREMKDSGVEWIGEIPKTWNIAAIKRNFNIKSGATPITTREEYWTLLFPTSDIRNNHEHPC